MIAEARRRRAGTTLLVVAAFSIGVCRTVSAVVFSTTGAYDETAVQVNNVDFNASFSLGTGGATAANTTTASTGNGSSYSTTGPFNASLAAAFTANAGGNWSFDTQATGTLSQANDLSYGTGQAKSITLTQTNGAQFLAITTGGPTHDSLSTSGSNYLDNQNGASYAFSFGSITGASPGETGVIRLGLTALSSNTPTSTPLDFGTVTAIATFSGGGSVTETAAIDSLKGAGDTFFGFVAPSGQTITGFSIASSAPSTGSPDIDDIAFITNGVVPEPAGILLFTCGAMVALGGRYRRK